MAWRGLHLSRPARLGVGDRQIVVTQDDGEVRLPIEDVAYVVVDTPQATLTAALVSACMEAGVAIMFTDDRHTPSGLTLPFHRHHRQAAVAALQADCSLPLKKRLWQALIVAKIDNQAAALRATGCAGAAALSAMARRVGSGDPTIWKPAPPASTGDVCSPPSTANGRRIIAMRPSTTAMPCCALA